MGAEGCSKCCRGNSSRKGREATASRAVGCLTIVGIDRPESSSDDEAQRPSVVGRAGIKDPFWNMDEKHRDAGLHLVPLQSRDTIEEENMVSPV